MTDEFLNRKYNPWYRSTRHVKKDGRDMVWNTYRNLVQLKQSNDTSTTVRAMVVKTLGYQLGFGGVAETLRQLGGRVVLTHRANKLNEVACRIKDCFNHNAKWRPQLGFPVFENGTRASLCFARRKHPEVVTKAKFGIAAVDALMRKSMTRRNSATAPSVASPPKEVRCRESLNNLPARDTIARAGWDTGYPKLQEETLVAFESNQVGSARFNESLAAWRAWMRGWGVEPRDDIIIAVMERQGIGTRTPSNVMRTVYNADEVVEMAAGWKKDSKSDAAVCDWSWMISQQIPPRTGSNGLG